MNRQRPQPGSRREFLSTLAGAAAAGLVGLPPRPAGAEPPPETTKITMVRLKGICLSPQYVAADLLRAEGFTEVRYVEAQGTEGIEKALASGDADINGHYAAPLILRLEAGDPIVILAGEHAGCFELFATDRIRTIRDLKGKTVAVPALDSSRHVFVSMMAAYVGLDPRKDINFVPYSGAESVRLLGEGKIDAYLGFPPEPQALRAEKIGHVVVNSAWDRPWSQYFCCMMAGNQTFVQKHPVATKRVIRAILKSADLCAVDPARAARFMVDKGFTDNYDYALQAVKSLPYGRWRQFNAEDTIRFYALRLKEIGLIKSSPQKIIAQGTDWRFLNELKKELKA
jgi:NitT/TauT family transport system substrate-binding protein